MNLPVCQSESRWFSDQLSSIPYCLPSVPRRDDLLYGCLLWFIFLPKIALFMSSVLLMVFSRNEHLCGSMGGERRNYTSLRPTAPPLSWIKHPHKLTLDNIQNQWQSGQSLPTGMCKYDSLPCCSPQITLPFPALRQHVVAGTVIDWSY